MRLLKAAMVLLTAGLSATAGAAPESGPAPTRETTQLAAEHHRLAGRIKDLSEKRRAAQETLNKLQADFAAVQEALATPGMENYIAPLLTERRKQLPDIATLHRTIRGIQDQANAVQVRHLSLGSELAALKDSDPRIQEIESLRKDYKRFFGDLASFSVLQSQLLAETQAFLRLIDENMLWLPSAPPIYQARFPSRLTPVPGTWRLVGRSIYEDLADHPFWYFATVLLLAGWLGLRHRAAAADRRIREQVSHPYTDSFKLTAGAFTLALYYSVPAPVVLWFLGARLAVSAPITEAAVYDFAEALSNGLERTAFFMFLALFLRRLCQRQGLAEAHFQWNPHTVRHLRRDLGWVLCVGSPLVFVVNFADYHPDAPWRESIGRLAGILGVLVLGLFLARMCHPRRGVPVAAHAEEQQPAPLPWLQWLWYFLAVAVPLALAITGATRYPHTAMELGRHLYRTMALALGLIIVHSLVVRFVLVSRQRAANRQAVQSRGESSSPLGAVSTEEGLQAAPESVPSLESISYHTRMLLRWLLALGLAVGVWVIWRDIIPAFSFIERVQLWSYGGEGGVAPAAIHLSDLLVAIIAAWTTAVLARNGPDVLDAVLLSRLGLDPPARFAVITIIRYLIVIVGVAVSLGAIGLGWSRISWLAAAITVGLGFGLQEIFANFVSGLIILFERPIRIGDVVTVGGVDGKVTRIQIRATTITDWNRRELIVPNKEFITGKISNWTLSDPVTRVDIPVGIAYGSDIKLARNLLLRIADECPHILKDPAPTALLRNFGDSTLDCELRVCIPNRDVWADMMHDVHTRIHDEFQRAGIEIACPQRDIRIRALPEGWPAGRAESGKGANP